MVPLTPALVVFVLLAVGSGYECPSKPVECKFNVGATCNNYSGEAPDNESTIDVCAHELFCGPTNKCQTRIPFGENCTSYDECAIGLYCSYTTSTCVDSEDLYWTTSPPGSACTKDSQCGFRQLNGSMTNSTCINGRCYGLSEGEACDYHIRDGTYQCLPGLYCDAKYIKSENIFVNGTCAKQKSKGEHCKLILNAYRTNEIGECGNYMACVQKSEHSNYTCEPYFQAKPGDYCDPEGLRFYCSYGYYCEEERYTCTALPLFSHKTCSSDSDCPSTESCYCDDTYLIENPGYCRPAGIAFGREEYDWNYCALTQNCLDQSCTTCDKEYCAFYDTLSALEKCGISEELYPLIGRCKERHGGLSTAEVVIITFAGVVAVTLTIIVAAWAIKTQRKKVSSRIQYHEVMQDIG